MQIRWPNVERNLMHLHKTPSLNALYPMSSDKLFFSVAKSSKQAFHVIQQWQKKMRNREIIFRLSLLLLKLGSGALSRNIAIFEHRSAFIEVYVLRLLFCLLWAIQKWCSRYFQKQYFFKCELKTWQLSKNWIFFQSLLPNYRSSLSVRASEKENLRLATFVSSLSRNTFSVIQLMLI